MALSKAQEIKNLVMNYPDSPNRRRILTELNGAEEQLNAFLFGIASSMGYRFNDDKTIEKRA